jgi:drug/metabolite transporter superfamily protein YnfA
MYPLVILGVVALVVFIFLQAINRNDMFNAGISLFIGVILTYFIVFLRWSDKKKQEKNDRKGSRDDKEDDDFLFWLNSKY